MIFYHSSYSDTTLDVPPPPPFFSAPPDGCLCIGQRLRVFTCADKIDLLKTGIGRPRGDLDEEHHGYAYDGVDGVSSCGTQSLVSDGQPTTHGHDDCVCVFFCFCFVFTHPRLCSHRESAASQQQRSSFMRATSASPLLLHNSMHLTHPALVFPTRLT